MSFNFILSIIIIAFIIAAAGYAVSHFLSLRDCAEAGLFYQELKREIDKSWTSEIASQTFSSSVPSGIESICIGNVSITSSLKEYDSLKRYRRQGYLLFFYPVEKACGQAAYKLEHLDSQTSGTLKCYQVKEGKVNFIISKDSAASLVSIK